MLESSMMSPTNKFLSQVTLLTRFLYVSQSFIRCLRNFFCLWNIFGNRFETPVSFVLSNTPLETLQIYISKHRTSRRSVSHHYNTSRFRTSRDIQMHYSRTSNFGSIQHLHIHMSVKTI